MAEPNVADIETTRSDMRDILWQNAELLGSDPNYRKKVWRFMSDVFYGGVTRMDETLSLPEQNNENAMDEIQTNHDNVAMSKEKLRLLLEREETYSDLLVNNNPKQVILMHKVRPKMERILEAYAAANENRFGLVGAVQLCAVILTTLNTGDLGDTSSSTSPTAASPHNDEKDTFCILQILTQIVRKYYEADEKLMKDETLLLIDVLCVNEEKLVRHLNKLEIDVIDLSVFVSSWLRCLFVHHFEIEFVQRVIDLVLLEGPSVLICIVYGIVQFVKNDLLQCETHYDVFEKLAGQKLKKHLKKSDFIHRVIQKAQLLFTEENYKYVIKGREKKSWPDLLGLPGARHFRIAKGVGDKTKVKKAYQHWRRESRKVISGVYLGADVSSDESDEDISSGKQSSNKSSSSMHTQNGPRMQSIREQNQNAERDEGDVEPATSMQTMIEHGATTTHVASASEHFKSPSMSRGNSLQLSDILYTSQRGDKIYMEPINDEVPPREIQCRTENWSDSWKTALASLNDASICMQGYLCKMTASKFNSRGTLDKIQRRWFVLRGNYMTYYKTNLHTQPKSDKCVNVLGFKVNPVIHAKSKYAFELISPPQLSMQKKRKKNSSLAFGRYSNSNDAAATSPDVVDRNDSDVGYSGGVENSMSHNYSSQSNQSQLSSPHHGGGGGNRERTKFVLIPDLDVDIEQQLQIRDKWVKSLRLATKGAFLWDVLLNLEPSTPQSATSTTTSSNSQQKRPIGVHQQVNSGPAATFGFQNNKRTRQFQHKKERVASNNSSTLVAMSAALNSKSNGSGNNQYQYAPRNASYNNGNNM
eukprot:CAMPEP_0202697630 /NCGR_PEP_ID=MMETSP1385-20130828/10948_1 /ASSEMBLY_ACC=CAM_ASM_000861 /TAXON_ID=933848 /ORGANISM="Elphidium margaritaceum" /LENGTH=813 /DNA_ID=CAMNT_0049354131 /DNA_START=32 /DNA_END=2473 /DNA_ORIENTATION=-